MSNLGLGFGIVDIGFSKFVDYRYFSLVMVC